MTAPATTVHTWPRNSAETLDLPIWDENAADAPVTTGTVAFVLKTAAGATVAGSSVPGTHLGAGVWRVVVPALALTAGAKYLATLTITDGGSNVRTIEWWVTAVLDTVEIRAG